MQEGYLYILKSAKNGKYYIGSCTEPIRRLADHNRGNTPSTRNRGPWFLAYSEKYPSLNEARIRERAIKKWKSKIMIEKLINSRMDSRAAPT